MEDRIIVTRSIDDKRGTFSFKRDQLSTVLAAVLFISSLVVVSRKCRKFCVCIDPLEVDFPTQFTDREFSPHTASV